MKWVYHCEKQCSDPCNPSVNCVAEFLLDLFEGVSHFHLLELLALLLNIGSFLIIKHQIMQLLYV